MNAEDAVEKAKRHYPRKPPGSDKMVQLMWLLVHSRREGLTREEFATFDGLVVELIPQIVQWHERWVVSICDTYAENGYGIMMAASGLRMMEKFAHPAFNPTQYERRATTTNLVDVHLNFLKRFTSTKVGRQMHLRKLLFALWKNMAQDPNSILGRFDSVSERDIIHDARSILTP